VECPPPCKREHARPARRHVERASRAAAQHDVGSGFPDSDHGEISCHDVASSKNSAGTRARLPIGARVVSGVGARWARAHGLASAGTIAAMPSWRWVAFVLWVTIAVSTPAHAQRAEGEAEFQRGKALMAEGKIAEACAAFEASNRIDPA